MKTLHVGCALVLSLGLLNCGSAGGLTKTSGSIAGTDTMNAAVTRGSNAHVDSYSVPLNNATRYNYQVCPAHVGWDVVATIVGPAGSTDNYYCDSHSTSDNAERCYIDTTSSGTYTLYVSDYGGGPGTGDTINRDYTVEVQADSAGTLAACPAPANP